MPLRGITLLYRPKTNYKTRLGYVAIITLSVMARKTGFQGAEEEMAAAAAEVATGVPLLPC